MMGEEDKSKLDKLTKRTIKDVYAELKEKFNYAEFTKRNVKDV